MNTTFQARPQMLDEMSVKNGYKILSELSSHFGTSTPLLEFKIRKKARRQGVYRRVLDREVGYITIHMDGDWVNTLLHEYAHHLDFCTHGVTHHTKTFAWCLYQIVKVYYGPYTGLYTWDVERKIVRTYYNMSCQIIQLWTTREELSQEMLSKGITPLDYVTSYSKGERK